MTKKLALAAAFASLAFIASTTAGHAATITDEFIVTGSNFGLISAVPAPVPFSNFSTTFDITFDPSSTINATENGFVLKSATAGFDNNYYGFQYSPTPPQLIVGGVGPVFGGTEIIGSANHFDLVLSPDLNTVSFLRYVTDDGQFEARDTSVSVSEVSAVPLPAALPMFGAAMIALGGFAAWRSRRTEGG